MTMDKMNQYLESRGFEVTREYVRGRHEYRFTISKNGITKSYYWAYPKNNTDITSAQKRAMDNMVKDFNEKAVIDNVFKASCNSLVGSIDNGYFFMPSLEIEAAPLYPKTLSIREYQKADAELTEIIERRLSGMGQHSTIQIKDVIFNDPATIVLWNDNTKTVVKAANEEFDPEKGLAMAIAKKFFGNKGNYYNNLKKWLK